MKVLIVEDDTECAQKIVSICDLLDWTSHWSTNLSDAFSAAAADQWNILILDRILHDGSNDGLELMDTLRASEINMAVVILSSLGATHHRIEGLDRGADAYLTKPFDMAELRACLKSIARRLGYLGGYSTIIQVGPLEIRENSRHATWAGNPLTLTEKGYRILLLLSRNNGDIVERETIWREVWPDQRRLPLQNLVLEQAMTRLRRELKKAGANDLIRTVRNRGYVIKSA